MDSKFTLSYYWSTATSPLPITESCHIKARTFHNGEWSATSEHYFIIPENVVTSEIITLYQNHPNLFNSVTYLPYRLHSGAHINLSVYNIAGQHIITLENTDKPSGYYVMEWNGLDQNNGRVADGIYFFRIAARGKERTSILTCKMLLIK